MTFWLQTRQQNRQDYNNGPLLNIRNSYNSFFPNDTPLHDYLKRPTAERGVVSCNSCRIPTSPMRARKSVKRLESPILQLPNLQKFQEERKTDNSHIIGQHSK